MLRSAGDQVIRIGKWLVVLAGLALLASAALAQGTPAGKYAAGQISEAEYKHVHSDLLYTHDGNNRGFGADHDLARANIVALMQAYGLNPVLHQFLYQGQNYYNVVGEMTGTTNPTQIYIIGGHYDSVNNPGADDNASGVAGVLEVARVLSPWPSGATIRFIGFDREEQGLIGSTAYANEHRNDDIRGMISMDMIAYHPTGPFTGRIYGRTQSYPLRDVLGRALQDYGNVVPNPRGSSGGSDHAPFENLGFQAVLLIEEYVNTNPHYHKQTDSVDTPGYINYPFATAMTRGVTGWLVDAAGVDPDHPLGDLNCDFVVNNFDIDPFVLALTDPNGYKIKYPDCDIMLGDINGDGFVNNFDIDPFVKLLTP